MTTLYVTEPYSLIKKDGDTLVVQIPADEATGRAARKVRVPLIKVDEVVVLGDSTLTAPALAALLDQRAEITLLNGYGQFRGRVVPAASRNSLLRLAQFRRHDDPVHALDLAKQFVAGKLSNLRTMLLRSNRKLNDGAIAAACESIQGILGQVDQLQSDGTPPADPSKPQAGSAWGSLQGLEGTGTAQYFGVFGRLLRGDEALGFERATGARRATRSTPCSPTVTPSCSTSAAPPCKRWGWTPMLATCIPRNTANRPWLWT